jgi:hypothetical protein
LRVKGLVVNSLVPVGAVALDVVVLEVVCELDVDDIIAGHEELPPAMYLYTSL